MLYNNVLKVNKRPRVHPLTLFINYNPVMAERAQLTQSGGSRGRVFLESLFLDLVLYIH